MTDPAQDLETFARRVLHLNLWPHQVEAAETEAFITVIAKARRTGGTTLAEALATYTAFRERGVKVLILSATQDAARRLTESIGQRLTRSRLTRDAVVDDYATRIRLTNGSEIISLPASQRQVRGYGEGVRLVILDEAGFMPEELWRAAHYTALDERPRSRVLMLGSPWGGFDHFFRRAFEEGQDADPDHTSFQWRAEVNPKLDQAYLERMRHRVSPAEYASEVLGEWSDAAGSLFSHDLLERNTADVELPPLVGLGPPARLLLGVDWGVSFDRSAAVAIGRLPVAHLNPHRPPRPIFGVAAVKVWAAGAELSKVVSEVVDSPSPWWVVSPEETGVGAGPSQDLLRRLAEKPESTITRNPVPTTAARKTEAYGRLLYLLEEGRLVLPRHPDLLRQLAGLRFEQGERGFLRIGADDPSTHDDVADALMLSTAPWARDGQAHCLLTDLAARTDPDVSVPVDGETVETGGGLVVHRHPWLQSVSGSELTRPLKGATTSEPQNPILERARKHLARRHLEVRS
ncbi:MAG: terminase family protein [Actinomycetota bacterium]|nr:terminase family protein [Actinomycetota bacterium]